MIGRPAYRPRERKKKRVTREREVAGNGRLSPASRELRLAERQGGKNHSDMRCIVI